MYLNNKINFARNSILLYVILLFGKMATMLPETVAESNV